MKYRVVPEGFRIIVRIVGMELVYSSETANTDFYLLTGFFAN